MFSRLMLLILMCFQKVKLSNATEQTSCVICRDELLSNKSGELGSVFFGCHSNHSKCWHLDCITTLVEKDGFIARCPLCRESRAINETLWLHILETMDVEKLQNDAKRLNEILQRKQMNQSLIKLRLIQSARHYYIQAHSEQNVTRKQSLLTNSVKEHPNYSKAHLELGVLFYQHLNNYIKAKEHIEIALRINWQNANAHEHLGVVFEDGFRDYKRARKEYEIAMKIDYNSAAAHHRLGGLQFRHLKNYTEAHKHLRIAVNLSPNDANFRTFFASMLDDVGRYDESRQELLKAIEINPGNDIAHANLGSLFEQRFQDYWQARVYYEKAVSINPNNSICQSNLGGLLMRYFGEWEKAKHYLDSAMKIDDSDALVHYNIGSWYMNFKQYQKARIHMEKAVKLDSSNAVIHCELGRLLHEFLKQDYDQARLHYEEAIKLDQHYTTAHQQLSMLLCHSHFKEDKRARVHLDIEKKKDVLGTNGQFLIICKFLKKIKMIDCVLGNV